MSNETQIKVCTWEDADKLLTYTAINIILLSWYDDIRKGGSNRFRSNGRWKDGGEIPSDYETRESDIGAINKIFSNQLQGGGSWDIKSKEPFSDVCWYSLKCLMISELKFARSILANKRLNKHRKRKYSKQSSRKPSR